MVGTGVASSASGQTVSCTVADGLRCVDNENGGAGNCADYEIRFYCQCKLTRKYHSSHHINIIRSNYLTISTYLHQDRHQYISYQYKYISFSAYWLR